jgi:hypothetical protein
MQRTAPRSVFTFFMTIYSFLGGERALWRGR